MNVHCLTFIREQKLTVNFAECEPVNDYPEVVQERQGNDHIPIVAELTGRIKHKRPSYAFNAVRCSVSVLPRPTILLSTAIETDGTTRVVI